MNSLFNYMYLKELHELRKQMAYILILGTAINAVEMVVTFRFLFKADSLKTRDFKEYLK